MWWSYRDGFWVILYLGYMAKIDRQAIYNKFEGRCAYTGKPLGNDWQVDHIWPKVHHRWVQPGADDPNNITNLLPAIKIINHYKRDHNLESFRKSMLNFHLRLKKLPKNTMIERTKKRILYMNTVADLFDIAPDKPFTGKFYFESIT